MAGGWFSVRVSKRARHSTAQNDGRSKLRCEYLKRKPALKALALRAVSAPLLIGLACLQTGCGSAPRETFDLAGDSPSIRSVAKGSRMRARLVIGEPEAMPPANSNRIVIRVGPTEVANLGGAHWADRLPRLVQAQLLKGFENAGIPATTPGKSASFTFATEIRRFEIDVTRGLAVVEIAARIIDDRNNIQRATRVFIAETPAPHTTGSEAPLALKAALETTIGEMAHWAAGVI
jgi:cholesterol transport system auxiliary component